MFEHHVYWVVYAVDIERNKKRYKRKEQVRGWLESRTYKHFEGSVFQNYAVAKGRTLEKQAWGDLLEQ